MNKLVIISLSLILISCGSSSSSVKQTEEPTNTKIDVTANKTDMLLGIQNREAFQTSPYQSWFNPNYENYNPDQEIVSALKPKLEDVEIKAFMGTWCGDSKRETPTFYKILDETDYDYSNLTLITVNRQKTTPNQLEEGLDIQRVPTFIFYKDGEEIGRYVEFARESLEKDMLAILSGEDYKHSYED